MTRAERHSLAKTHLISAIARHERANVRLHMAQCMQTAPADGIVRMVVAADGVASDACESAVKAALAENSDLIPVEKGFRVSPYGSAA